MPSIVSVEVARQTLDMVNDGDDTSDSDGTPPCPSLAHCAEVDCAGDSGICARCEDGFADPGGGSRADLDDCAAAPCGLATCVDTGANRYECRAGDGTAVAAGGTSIIYTPLGPFVATAGPDAFVDEAGAVRLVVLVRLVIAERTPRCARSRA